MPACRKMPPDRLGDLPGTGRRAAPGGATDLATDLAYALDPDLCAVSATCVQIERDLVAARLNAEQAGLVALICAEALNNIVEHAQAGKTGGWITVSIDPAPPCRVTIRDDGTPMPGGIPPKGRAVEPGQSHDSVPEGGFGWFLIRSLTEQVVYARVGAENVLTVIVRPHLAL